MKFSPNRFKMLFVLILVCFLAGCLGNDGGKSLTDMTEKEKLVIMFNVYNQQYADYMIKTGYTKTSGEWKKISSPSFTDDQKDILKKKKEILTNVYPMIVLYDSFMVNHRQIDPATEQQIFSLLDTLVQLIPD